MADSNRSTRLEAESLTQSERMTLSFAVQRFNSDAERSVIV